jgi:predicted nucleotidyltransferase
MLQEFRKFVGNKVLEYFITHPSTEIHLRDLSRRLEISSGSARSYCNLFERDDILHLKRKGNLKLFSLNNDNIVVRELKNIYYVILLKEFSIEKLVGNYISLAIYGSFASGEYDERSDLDILIIGEEKDVNKDKILTLQESLKREIQLTVIPYYKWEKMKKEGDRFVENILRNHILIGGAEL